MVSHSVVHFEMNEKIELAGRFQDVDVFIPETSKLVPFDTKNPDAIVFSIGFKSIIDILMNTEIYPIITSPSLLISGENKMFGSDQGWARSAQQRRNCCAAALRRGAAQPRRHFQKGLRGAAQLRRHFQKGLRGAAQLRRHFQKGLRGAAAQLRSAAKICAGTVSEFYF